MAARYARPGGGDGALQLRRLERARAPDRQRRAGRSVHQRRRSADGARRRRGAIDVTTRVPISSATGSRSCTMPGGPAVARRPRRCSSRQSAASRLAIRPRCRPAATRAQYLQRARPVGGARAEAGAGRQRARGADGGRERQRRRRHHLRNRRRDVAHGARAGARHLGRRPRHASSIPPRSCPRRPTARAPSGCWRSCAGRRRAAIFRRYKFVPLEPGADAWTPGASPGSPSRPRRSRRC